ncbi:hypothetical protein PENDEC_c005G04250 [Penicillium decumbens]|uniref:Uncharacterized protein n=1 Tax=Penicillium decumbens TaxID=69771 RepID=A0A1V6PGK8_PENDC|nr:hypothetical protein PENDEC_c005G04250 [Penicillium decumbens]
MSELRRECPKGSNLRQL